MKRRETCRTDSRLHRSRYQFCENPSFYCMDTAHVNSRHVEPFNNTAYHKPGQNSEMYEKKFDDYTMYRSRQGLIDEKIRDIINGYGTWKEYRNYEKHMSDKERQACFEVLDEDEKNIILRGEVKDILNGCGDYRDFDSFYKIYLNDKEIKECLDAFEKYY